MKRLPRLSLLLSLSMLFGPCLALAQPPAAGSVVMSTGPATASHPTGTIRPLEKGSPVFSGETLHTSPGAFVNVKFTDGSYTLLRPSTRLEISSYAYTAPTPPPAPPVTEPSGETPDTGTPAAASEAPAATTPSAPLATLPAPVSSGLPERAFLRLLKGGFRAVSGAIGKLNQDDYRINTPVATIGIRGTQPFVQLVEDDSPFIDQMGLPEGVQAAGGAIVGTFEGEIEVETQVSVVAHLPGSIFTGADWDVAQAGGGGGLGSAGQRLRLTAGQFIFIDRRGRSSPLILPPFVNQTQDPSSPSCN